MRKKSKLFFYLLIYCCSAGAQNFAIKANLAPVTASGFYSVNITPQLSSYATINFSDLRVADEAGKFVPYIIHSKRPSFVTQNYHRLPIIKNELNDSGKSELNIKNETNIKISSIALLIRNAAVNRLAAISGSDDEKKWFTISEHINLEDLSGNDTDRYVQTVNFPVSSYQFFKIVIDNKKNNPLNIIEAGSYSNVEHTADAYTSNPSLNFIQIDSADANSYIKIHQSAAYHVNQLILQIDSPKFFNRDIEILNSEDLPSFNISSNKNNEITLPSFNDRDFAVKIYNGDNPPLKIKAIILKQESKNIITYLSAEKKYHLLIHDSAAMSPLYDLQKFEDSVPVNIPELKIISFENINRASTIKNNTGLSSVWIWILILIAIATLGFVTFRLMSEMKKDSH